MNDLKELSLEEKITFNGGFRWTPYAVGIGIIIEFTLGLAEGYQDGKERRKYGN
ncbi:hypothetical protein [Mongoliitalea daihaiensis]|uniref:hypothetical protein n=1 Tax=Mongoliitalea daihaiensis TaxID=2782006 RepID=UPI001F1C7D36|nr:hypothetical protein [Mongoliitalea daihaiensis]UJP66768.1 hypothetical protein IPZ59_09355 [Mongoliitalea daihaiensis]